MAHLDINDNTVTVVLSKAEKVGAVSGDVVVPRTSVTAVTVLDDAAEALRGWRAPGVDLPRGVKLGTWRGRREKIFVAVRPGARGVEVTLAGQDYAALLVSVDDPETVAEQLAAAASSAAD